MVRVVESVNGILVPGRLLKLTGSPLGHGPQSQDSHDAYPKGGQNGTQQAQRAG